jgi:chemotaxis protein MotB
MSRKKRPERSNHERWLVSYADFITLLFAFFVVLYASAQVDKRKAGKLAIAIQAGFSQMGAFKGSAPISGVRGPDPRGAKVPIENADVFQPVESLVPNSTNADSPDMDQIQNRMELALSPEIRNRTASVTSTKEGIVVSLSELGFFDSGSAALQPSALPILAEFVEVAGSLHARIRIEGHTDNVPIHNGHFDSNWELSTARATEITKLFITRYAIEPGRLSASGYGEYYPVASNDTPQGRAMNRRIDLVILDSNAQSSAKSSANPLPKISP